MADNQDRIAKALIKKFKPYFNEKTNKLQDDAPEDAKKAFRQFNELLDDMVEKGGILDNPPYHADEKSAMAWKKKAK